MTTTSTPDASPSQSIDLPRCIDASALYSLAGRLKALEAYHANYGGQAEDLPCLTSVLVQEGRVFAIVASGPLKMRLELIGGTWVMG
jgi:hypothetical protein